jgi:excisionase family DNA binding protein
VSELIRLTQLAEALGVSVSTVTRWVEAGYLPEPASPPGGWRVFCSESLPEWARERMRAEYLAKNRVKDP